MLRQDLDTITCLTRDRDIQPDNIGILNLVLFQCKDVQGCNHKAKFYECLEIRLIVFSRSFSQVNIHRIVALGFSYWIILPEISVLMKFY